MGLGCAPHLVKKHKLQLFGNATPNCANRIYSDLKI